MDYLGAYNVISRVLNRRAFGRTELQRDLRMEGVVRVERRCHTAGF